MTSSTEALLHDGYAAWTNSKGNFDPRSMLDLYADDVEVSSATHGGEGHPALAMIGTYRGKAGVQAYFEALTDHWVMERFSVERIIADGERAAVVLDMAWRSKATGKLAASKKVDLWTFREGLAVRLEQVFDSRPLLEAIQP